MNGSSLADETDVTLDSSGVTRERISFMPLKNKLVYYTENCTNIQKHRSGVSNLKNLL